MTDDGSTMHLSLTAQTIACLRVQIDTALSKYCQILLLHNGAAVDSGPPECEAVSVVVGFSTILKITFKDKAVPSCLTSEDVGITFLRNDGTQCHIPIYRVAILRASSVKTQLIYCQL
jgi:hypothetical protein